MSGLNRRSKIILIFFAFLIMLALVAWGTSSVYGASLPGEISAPQPTSTPGLVVYGVVRNLSGSAVGGVNIYRRYASYQGVIIATTDANGFYQSDFYYIPEMRWSQFGLKSQVWFSSPNFIIGDIITVIKRKSVSSRHTYPGYTTFRSYSGIRNDIRIYCDKNLASLMYKVTRVPLSCGVD